MGRSGKWRVLGLIAVIAVAGAFYWWTVGGREAVFQLLSPRFRVVGIDLNSQTMELRQTNRTYSVRCQDACRDFVAGESYAAVDRGSDLDVTVGGRRVRCPIIKIEVRFDARPGGVGSYVRPKTQRARTVLDVG